MKIELSHVIDLIFEDLQDVRDMTDDAVQSLALNNVQGALGAIAGLSAKLAAAETVLTAIVKAGQPRRRTYWE